MVITSPKGRYYIRAASSRVDNRTLVIKQGDTFGVFDRHGDIHPIRAGEEGIYHEGTRFLSHLDLLLGNNRPLLLNSGVRRDSAILTADLTNPDMELEGVLMRRGALHLFRTKFLWDGACYERLRFTNFLDEPVTLPLTIKYSVDFADTYKVRGIPRRFEGERLPPRIQNGHVEIGYKGRDEVLRATEIHWSPTPTHQTEGEAISTIELPPNGTRTMYMTVDMQVDSRPGTRAGPPGDTQWDRARTSIGNEARHAWAGACKVHTGNEQFNAWLDQSVSDLRMMLTRTPHGWYPYAGVPWFSTVFGRDGIITAFEALWFQPMIARGVLAYLAAHQADRYEKDRDAEPGKILHEARKGEMPATGEVPFARYYGTIDATPLFVMLAGAYLERTGDTEFLAKIWPNVQRALEWMHGPGDPDEDGFLEYKRQNPNGLLNQGWKDSDSAVFHADGDSAPGSIALCEVQGYAWAARRAAATIAHELGHDDEAQRLKQEARALHDDFDDAFWSPSLGTYALALDGHKNPCEVITSNPGQVLWSGIARKERSANVAKHLLREESFSGWGIRTVAANEARYNPMSYHNGSVWPHDSALVAAGLARYGHKGEAMRILTGLFDASVYLDLHRMPELFCGFPRRPHEGPTNFPLACAPQAWATGIPMLWLETALGLRIEALHNRVILDRPMLPPFLERVELRDLPLGPQAGRPDGEIDTMDIVCERAGEDVTVHVPRRKGDMELLIIK